MVDKEQALMGQGINPIQLRNNLTILVLSAQSFIENIRVKNGQGAEQQKPRAYRENGYLQDHPNHYAYPENLIEGVPPTALIQVIAQQRPLVIVDESHNFKADLRVDLLNNIHPRFILELTATPRDNSNIISFVDAMQLKCENMVKLPVIVENRNTPKDVLINAIRLRNSLEQHAKLMEKQGGRYIRPIVLFQAQPKTDSDNETFEKIKENLINLGIPEEQIKIKTANKDELEGLDLLSRNCDVRYIITVNALKEGWDCPFAYILATLANKTSRVDVEQILGRILRQPYTIQHQNELLNISYVFTSSNDFRDTVERIIISLQKAGYSKKDFRETSNVEQLKPQKQLSFLESTDGPAAEEETTDGVNFTEEETKDIKKQLHETSTSEDIQRLQEQAEEASVEYKKLIQEQTEGREHDPLAAITPKEMYYSINENYKEAASSLNIPMFYVKTAASIFSNDEWILLEKSMLTKGFNLPTKDATIDFTIVRPTGVTIDIVESGDDYVPVRRSNQQTIDYIRQQYLDKSVKSKKNILSRQIANMIRLDSVPEPDIKRYVDKVIENLDEDEISSLVDNLYQTRDTIQKKIETLLKDYQKQVFQHWLNTGKILLKDHFTFIEKVAMTKGILVGVDKGLYAAEENVNNFEHDVITAISENTNVLFWHRNRERKDFCINGFINHYPRLYCTHEIGANNSN